jgi:uncharacterized membrane protein YadS
VDEPPPDRQSLKIAALWRLLRLAALAVFLMCFLPYVSSEGGHYDYKTGPYIPALICAFATYLAAIHACRRKLYVFDALELAVACIAFWGHQQVLNINNNDVDRQSARKKLRRRC